MPETIPTMSHVQLKSMHGWMSTLDMQQDALSLWMTGPVLQTRHLLADLF